MSGPAHLSFPSPLGALTAFEEDGMLVALEHGRAPTPGTETPLLAEVRRQLDEYFDGKRETFDIPVAPAGPKRRREIWVAMAEIPYGETETYGELAARIGSSARAVGQACGANPIPIVLPCHRVLGAGNALAGFSFADGPETKRRLLHLENPKAWLL